MLILKSEGKLGGHGYETGGEVGGGEIGSAETVLTGFRRCDESGGNYDEGGMRSGCLELVRFFPLRLFPRSCW